MDSSRQIHNLAVGTKCPPTQTVLNANRTKVDSFSTSDLRSSSVRPPTSVFFPNLVTRVQSLPLGCSSHLVLELVQPLLVVSERDAGCEEGDDAQLPVVEAVSDQRPLPRVHLQPTNTGSAQPHTEWAVI